MKLLIKHKIEGTIIKEKYPKHSDYYFCYDSNQYHYFGKVEADYFLKEYLHKDWKEGIEIIHVHNKIC